jgi:hypothetical protein
MEGTTYLELFQELKTSFCHPEEVSALMNVFTECIPIPVNKRSDAFAFTAYLARMVTLAVEDHQNLPCKPHSCCGITGSVVQYERSPLTSVYITIEKFPVNTQRSIRLAPWLKISLQCSQGSFSISAIPFKMEKDHRLLLRALQIDLRVVAFRGSHNTLFDEVWFQWPLLHIPSQEISTESAQCMCFGSREILNTALTSPQLTSLRLDFFYRPFSILAM